MKLLLFFILIMYACCKIPGGEKKIARDSAISRTSISSDSCVCLSKGYSDDFFYANKKRIPKELSDNYDNYSQLQDQYLIVRLLTQLQETCSVESVDFYMYVFMGIIKNKNADGFTGEAFSSTARFFFENYPENFYRLISCSKKINADVAEEAANLLGFELVNSFSKDSLAIMFEAHKQSFSEYSTTVDFIETIILNY